MLKIRSRTGYRPTELVLVGAILAILTVPALPALFFGFFEEEVVSRLSTSGSSVTAVSLHGVWNVNFLKTIENQTLTEEARTEAASFIGTMQIRVTFTEDGTMTMNATLMGQPETRTGSYEVISVDGNTITIRATKTETGSAPEVETIVMTFENENSIMMRPSDGALDEMLYFDRAN